MRNMDVSRFVEKNGRSMWECDSEDLARSVAELDGPMANRFCERLDEFYEAFRDLRLVKEDGSND